MFKKLIIVAGCMAAAMPASAAVLDTVANDYVGTVGETPPFGALNGAVGSSTIGTGIDFTFGNVEGIFLDGGTTYAFCGINSAGNCDLQTDVDGRVVVAGSTNQGLTNFISAEAGFAADGALSLSVFDINGLLLETALNGPPAGPQGRTTFSITRGSADIASFRISGVDSFGVNQVSLENPLAAMGGVPEPGTWALLILGMGAVGGAMRRTRRQVGVSFA